MELTRKQLTCLIGTILLTIICGFKYILQYMNWLLNDSKIPLFMLWMLIISIVTMTLILLSEIHIKNDSNTKVKEKLQNENSYRLCNEQ